MANKRGMSRHAASFIKSPDNSAKLFERRGDKWQTRKDALMDFGVSICPCCGQPTNPDYDSVMRAEQAPSRREMGPDRPLKPKGLTADAEALKRNEFLKLRSSLRKKGVKI